MKYDVIIIGQGLAGSLLAIELIENGKTVRVIDDGHQSSSTKIAAGMMNPIIGKRLTPLWTNKSDKNTVITHYQSLEKILDTSFVNKRRLIRYLSDPLELESYKNRRVESRFKEAVCTVKELETLSKIADTGNIQFQINDVIQINTPALLQGTKRYLENQNAYIHDVFSYTDLKITDTVTWKELTAKYIVFCEGAKGDKNPYFEQLEFKNTFGHILELSCNKIPESTILNHGKWLCPSERHSYKYGATSYWNDTVQKKQASEDALQTSLNRFLKVPYEIQNIYFGVRPVLKNRLPFAGFHPTHTCLGMINGLGGQGISLAPLVVKSLADTLYSKIVII